ncbi:MAG: hypothetical protein DPW11_02845 [bacterium]|nr:hypothetical protein [Candidatus Microgenomates bacterium CPR3]MCQ3944689.1 hypothetical protein [bacterium]RIK51251.1 MAG: hypothetical protein DCC61_03135 [Candidatus Microgenomates bacterium]
MSGQDAADIVQMNSLSSEIPVVSGGKKKSSLLWIVLGCVVMGVGLGVFVYQQSLAPAPKPSATPRASKAPTASVSPVVPSPVTPTTNEVGPVSNTLTFPKKGKLRIYHTLNNIQMVLQLTINGTVKTITLPNKATSATTPANFADSSFEVEAGSTGTLVAYLNSTSGPKLRGWIPPMDSNNKKECGVAGGSVANNEEQIAFIKSKLAGESIFEYQCWEDDDVPGEFNDLYMVWTYAPSTATVSPSPAASATTSPSPSASVKVSPSPSPSPSVKASTVAVASPTPTPSTRAAMPDTSEGVPVTGVFEITVGTVSVGLLLLVLGLFGLLSL